MFYLFLLAVWYAGYGSDTWEAVCWVHFRLVHRSDLRELRGGFRS